MKIKWLSLLLSWFFISWGVCGELNADGPEYLNLPISVVPSNTLYQNIQTIAQQTRLPICVAATTATAAKFNKEFGLSGNIDSLRDFAESLKKLGYELRMFESGIIVSTQDFEKSPDNPLDSKITSFEFEGSHEKFIHEIGKYFVCGLRPSLITSSSLHSSKKIIEIRSSNSISVGELLIMSARESSLLWNMQINSNVSVLNYQDLSKLEMSRIKIRLISADVGKGTRPRI